ncbi:MAG: sugar kinase [Planctomycetes bacterium]|nr:sugar kinase [Planctomycetota bacterium]
MSQGPASETRIVLVRRRTRLEDLIARYNTASQARFYVEHLGADFSDYQNEHDRYVAAVRAAEEALRDLGRVHPIDRAYLPNYLFGPRDVVVAIGQDGLVANTVKYLDGQPLIGVNPDPERWDGVLLPFSVEDLATVAREVIAGRRRHREITMAKGVLTDGQVLHAVNDLFIGPRSHTSARYRIRLGDHEEAQSSSGVIVSTGLGSTGWYKSLVAGAAALNGRGAAPEKPMPWDAEYLVFTVREPFPSRSSAATLVHGRVDRQPLELVSQMPEHGVVFSDGIEQDFIAFNAGATLTVSVAERRGRLVI